MSRDLGGMTTQSKVARPKARRFALALILAGAALPATPPAHARTRSHATIHMRHAAVKGARGPAGIASVYDGSFHGRRMADGHVFSVASDSAASRTLPLGTTATVVNLENGRRQNICIRDRMGNRGHAFLDLSPATAHRLGMGRPGLIHVVLTSLRFPVRSTGS